MAAKTQTQQDATNKVHDHSALLDKLLSQCEKIQAIADRASPQELADKSALAQAIYLADAFRNLRIAVTDEMMQSIMSLQGSALGFRTDKDKTGGYPLEIVRDCFIEATLCGARPIGNEWNIIAGRRYLTKEFYERSFPLLPGITNVDVVPGVPTIHNGKTVVRMAVRWKHNGVQQELRDQEGKPGRTFVIRANDGMMDDAIIGKAKRKALKAAYEMVLGRSIGDIDDEQAAVETKAATTKIDDLTAKLKGQKPEHLPDGELPPLPSDEAQRMLDELDKLDAAEAAKSGELFRDKLDAAEARRKAGA